MSFSAKQSKVRPNPPLHLLSTGQASWLDKGSFAMNESTLLRDQLLTTKFFIPSPSHTLIPRPRLTAQLSAVLLPASVSTSDQDDQSGMMLGAPADLWNLLNCMIVAVPYCYLQPLLA